MTDMMRDMIAQLMGAQRAEEEGRKLPPYDHHSVCRAYLLDCCPREILIDTRLENLVSCRRLHETALRSDYQREQAKKDHCYEVEAYEALEEAVKAVDYEIERTRDKVKKDSESLNDSHDYIKNQKINELNEKIASLLSEMEALGSEGKVHESVELSRTVSDLQRRKADMEHDLRAGQPAQQRLRVCEACGAQLNILDHESRLADHYGGKMHLGMVLIREKFDEMKQNIDERRAAKQKIDDGRYNSGGGGGYSGGGDRERYYGRGDRGRGDYDRERGGRDAERDRDRRPRDNDRNDRGSGESRRHRRSRSNERDSRDRRSSPSRRHRSRSRERSSRRYHN